MPEPYKDLVRTRRWSLWIIDCPCFYANKFIKSYSKDSTPQLKNIAVAKQYQNKGIGSRLLDKVVEIAKGKNYQKVIVGTADCGINQIRFYERNGFMKYGVKENFFLEIYDQPIYENGIQLKDMVMLKKKIQK